MSFIRIDKEALRRNLSTIGALAPLDKIYAVLKDNAYGHGLCEFAALCSEFGIKHAIVRDTKEAILISAMFESVLVLAETTCFEAPTNVHFALNSAATLDKIPSGTKVQLKVDSGMHRNGVSPSELSEVLGKIVSKNLELTGVFSHLRSADELSSESFWQEKNFLKIKSMVVEFCSARKLKTPLFHLQNSAGLFRNGSLGEFDMARVGIAMYGYLDMPKAVGDFELSPVMSLWADKIASRKLSRGQAAGYGAVGKTDKNTIVSTYDIGYADGFLRVAADSEYILPNGSRLVGRISMDNIIVECEDESVCVFDNASLLAKRYNTISYEIMVRLNPNIKRITG